MQDLELPPLGASRSAPFAPGGGSCSGCCGNTTRGRRSGTVRPSVGARGAPAPAPRSWAGHGGDLVGAAAQGTLLGDRDRQLWGKPSSWRTSGFSAAAIWEKLPAWERRFRANNSRNCSAPGHLACGDDPSRACSWQSTPSLAARVSLWSVSSPGQSPSVTHKPGNFYCPRTALLPQRRFAQMPAVVPAPEVAGEAGKELLEDKAKA